MHNICSSHDVCMQELPSSRAQVDQMTMRTRSMLPPPRQATQLLSRETSRSTPLRLTDVPLLSIFPSLAAFMKSHLSKGCLHVRMSLLPQSSEAEQGNCCL